MPPRDTPPARRYNALMNDSPGQARDASETRDPVALRWLGGFALVAAILLPISLAWRTLSSPDIGYHLAYGRRFLNGRGIVDDNAFIYTSVNRPDAPDNLKTGPGSWYDADGRYRFPNANYAGQIVMAFVYRLGGAYGLCLLQAILIAAVFGLIAGSMLRMGISPGITALGVLLATAVSYERFNLRPEVFGYVILAVQLLLLARGRIGRAGAAGLILAQWAFVQFHIYWPLGIALTLCFVAEALLRWAWTRNVTRKPLDGNSRRRLRMFAIVLAGQVAVVSINPWTWRLAAFPFQVAAYMVRCGISARSASGHPWATVGELSGVFSGRFGELLATPAVSVLLAITGVAVVCAAIQRRWAKVFLMLGFAYMCLFQTRRRIAVGAFVLVPIAVSSCLGVLRAFFNLKSQAGRKRFFAGRVIRITAPVLLIALSGWWIARIATNRFYYDERRSWRFGAEFNRLDMPMRVARALQTLPPDARVFTSFNVSSNLLHFSRTGETYRQMPILTNGFAYPPDVMEENIRICAGYRPFSEFQKRYDVKIVVLDCTASWAPLIQELLRDPDWTPACIDASRILFVRKDLSTDLSDNRNAGQFIADVKSLDPMEAFALHRAAKSFYYIGLGDLAIALAAEATKIDADYYEAWTLQGICLLARAKAFPDAGSNTARKDLLQARRHLKRALDVHPGYAPAVRALADTDNALRRMGG